MTTFLRDFLHKDRDQAEELDVVIINKYGIFFMNFQTFFVFSNKEKSRKSKWKPY
jgi:hypothetical protein